MRKELEPNLRLRVENTRLKKLYGEIKRPPYINSEYTLPVPVETLFIDPKISNHTRRVMDDNLRVIVTPQVTRRLDPATIPLIEMRASSQENGRVIEADELNTVQR
jgi:hypothetical protein